MVQLKKTKEWSGEHREEDVTGTVRLYVGQLYCGYAEPVRDEVELYHFHPTYDFMYESLPDHPESLENIKLYVELSLKEFATKFCYTKQKNNESKD